MTLPERRLASLDDANDAGLADPGHHLVAAEGLEFFLHDPGRAMHLVKQLRVFMDVPAPGRNLVLHAGNAIDDGHG